MTMQAHSQGKGLFTDFFYYKNVKALELIKLKSLNLQTNKKKVQNKEESKL